MSVYWDCKAFQNSDKDFDSVGKKFIIDLQFNIKVINELFLKQQFPKSINYITEIICQSKKVFAHQLDESAQNLKIFLEQFMEEKEGITISKSNFAFEQQKQAATKFIELMEIAKWSLKDWNQFRNQVLDNTLFQLEIKELKDTYNIQQDRENCSFCQIF